MRVKLSLIFFLLLTSSAIFAQEKTGEIYGVVRDAKGNPLEGVLVYLSGARINTSTESGGGFKLQIPCNEDVTLISRSLGYTQDSVVLSVNPGERREVNFVLSELSDDIDAVRITGNEQRRGVIERLDVRTVSKVSGASNSFENILKVEPGVHSSNELSSQYSVRGGSYDENLVYVNGVEIYRPMLTRTGQQEGLSFINPSLVSSVEFSTGGFGAEFGDKMSSVLNVGYKRPTTFGGSAEGSLMGASASCNFAAPNRKFGGAVGLRYKRATYLLGTLDTKGEYNPSFSDIQTTLYYEPTSKLSFSALGSYSLNKYKFSPTNRKTSFGTLDNPQDFTVYYEGNENDMTESLLGALTARYRASSDFQLGLTGSAVSMVEQEQYDILGEYWLQSTLSSNEGSSDINVGGSRDHARNYTATQVYTVAHDGSWRHANGRLKWGIKAQYHYVSDEVSQWQMVDSAGYLSPYNPQGQLAMTGNVYADTSMSAWQYSGFLQEAYKFEMSGNRLLRVTPGVRFNYSAASKEFLISPRLQLIFYPNEDKDLQFFAAAGAYFQPAFYKEMKRLDTKNSTMQLNTSVEAQRSWHFTLGLSTVFTYNDIPCKFTSEVYYKLLRNLVPYKQDNVSLLYDWEHQAKGYVWGVDAKLSTELVKGAESWVSLSLMQAMQDVEGDSYVNRNGETVYPGYFPMANDQRFNVSIMLQDQLFNYPHWRAYLVLNYGTGLPSFVPVEDRYDLTFRMPSYQRVDMGFSYVLFDDVVHSKMKQKLGNKLQSCIITVEALNLFNRRNVSSYLWVKTVQYGGQSSAMVAVPNYLTPFRFNVKLALTF